MKKSLTVLAILLSISGFCRSSKGKEFWIAYMENLSLAFNGPPAFKIHVASEVSTTCTLSVPFTGYTSTFVVGANQVYVFNLPAGNYNPFGDEATANNGIRIVANDSVEVKAFHHRVCFTESSIILPLHEIGFKYLVMAQADSPGNSPSEFVVIATQNNTNIEIIPSVLTSGTRPVGVPFTVTLQRGQMYQIQAFGDLSGTSVRSLDTLKKIAVFGGARQAIFGNAGGADDHVYDQIYPVSSFGMNYNVVPFSGHTNDYVKILASQNGTNVWVTGGTNFTLSAGQTAVFVNNSSCEITSNHPIAVAQLASAQSSGDPGMIMLVPSDLYLRKALFYTPGTIKIGSSSHFFKTHRVNIVIKNTAIGNLQLDNVAIPSGSFNPVALSSNYSYVRLVLDTLTSLQHTLTCDSGFNATINAFDFCNFYGHHLGFYKPEKPAPVDPTGLHKNESSTSISIFPVPASGALTVQAARSIRSIQVINLFGKEVLTSWHNSSTQVSINVSTLADGIYYCRVQYDDNAAASEVLKFIKIAKE